MTNAPMSQGVKLTGEGPGDVGAAVGRLLVGVRLALETEVAVEAWTSAVAAAVATSVAGARVGGGGEVAVSSLAGSGVTVAMGVEAI
jgi:hypothetical protein